MDHLRWIKYLSPCVVAIFWRSGIVIAGLALLVSGWAACAPASADPPGGTSGWSQTFDEEFNGSSINTGVWIPQATYTQNGNLYPSPNYVPGGYSPICYYVPGNVYEGGNVATLVAKRENNDPPGGSYGTLPYDSAWLVTQNFQQTYGYFECSMDAGSTPGIDTTFWLLNRNQWPPEIDIAEVPSASQVYIWGNYYTGSGYGINQALHGASGSDGDVQELSQPSYYGYHTYGVDWEPDHISWYIDGNLSYTTTDTANIPNVPMYMLLSMELETGNNSWFGDPSTGAYPTYTYVDWVRAWKKTGNTHSGSWACKAVLASNPSWTKIYQVANVAQNKNYVASFWVKGAGNLQLSVLNGSWGSGITPAVNVAATGNWQQITTPAFNTGSDSQITFIIQDFVGGTAGTAYVDDCFLGPSGGGNVLGNPGFESGNTGWQPSGVFSIAQNP